jgi:hypothetical protein
MSILFLSKIVSNSVPSATFSRVINEIIGRCPEKASTQFGELHSFDRQTLKRLLLLEKFVKQSLQDFDPRDRHKIAAQFEQCQHAFYAFGEALTCEMPDLNVQDARHALIIAVDKLDLIKIDHGQFAGKVVAHAVTQAQLPQGRNYQMVTRLIDTYVDGPKRTRPREFWSGASLEDALSKKDKTDKPVNLVGATVELGKAGAITILQDDNEGPADSATRTLSGKTLDGTLYSIVIWDGRTQVQKMYANPPLRPVTFIEGSPVNYAKGDTLTLNIPGTLFSQTDTFTVVSVRQDGDSQIIRVFKGKDIFELTSTDGQLHLKKIGKLSSAKVGRVYYAEDPAMVKAPYAHDKGVLAAIGDSSNTHHPLLVKEPKDKDGKQLHHTDPREMTGEEMRIHLLATAARYGDRLTVTPDGKIISDTMAGILKLDPENAAGLNRHNRYNRGLYGVNAAADPMLVFTDPTTGQVTLKAIVRGDLFETQVDALSKLLDKGDAFKVVTADVLRHEKVKAVLEGINNVTTPDSFKEFLSELKKACAGANLNAKALEKYFKEGTKLTDIAAKITDLFESLRSAITEVHHEILEGSGSQTRPNRQHIKDVLNALKVKVAFPGGMVEGKDIRATLIEEMIEELGLEKLSSQQLDKILDEINLQLIFQGINTDDTRNTLCSSMGTSAFLIDLNQSPTLMSLIKGKDGATDALTSKFVDITPHTICEMAFSHGSYMAQVLAHKIDIAEDELRKLQFSDPSADVKGKKRKPDIEKATQDRITLLNAHIQQWQEIINAFIRHYSTKAPKFKAHATTLEELPRTLTDTMSELPTQVELEHSRLQFPHKKLANLRNERLLAQLRDQAEAEKQGESAEGKVHKKLLGMVKELVKRADLSRGQTLQFNQSLNESIWSHSPDKFKVLILDWLHQEYKAHVPKSERSWGDFLTSAFGQPVLKQVQDFSKKNVVSVLGIAGIVKECFKAQEGRTRHASMKVVWENTDVEQKLEILEALRLALPSKIQFSKGEGEYNANSKKKLRFEEFLKIIFDEDTRAKVLEFCTQQKVYTKYIPTTPTEVDVRLGGPDSADFGVEPEQMQSVGLGLPPIVNKGIVATLKSLSSSEDSSGSRRSSLDGEAASIVPGIVPPPPEFASNGTPKSQRSVRFKLEPQIILTSSDVADQPLGQNGAPPPPPPPLPVAAAHGSSLPPAAATQPQGQGGAPPLTFFSELNQRLSKNQDPSSSSSSSSSSEGSDSDANA